MNIVLLGATGQLGRDLAGVLAHEGQVIPLGRQQLELTDKQSIHRAIIDQKPALVVNTAAYNLVDRAEDEPEAAFAVNAFGVRELAIACRQAGATLLHFSTDYVFGLDESRREPYREDDLPGPISVYGASKLAGEHFARMHVARHFIVRTCGLYGTRDDRGPQIVDRGSTSATPPSSATTSTPPQSTTAAPRPPAPKPAASGKPSNFVQTMLRLGRERGKVRVVNDQVCTPTSTADLAGAVGRLIQTGAYGTYHVTNAGQCSWYELACEIFRIARKIGLLDREVAVRPIPSSQFPAKARRPAYSVLSCDKLTGLGLSPMRPWKEALAAYLEALAQAAC